MEYHVRPFPQEPHRGGKELKLALADLETFFGEDVPDLEKLRSIQAKVHKATNHFNDDKLIDMVRQISSLMDEYQEKPSKELMRKIIENVLKVRIELKHI